MIIAAAVSLALISCKKAEKRNITLGIMNENEVIVKSGLTEKDVIFLVPPDDIAEQ